MNISTTQTGLPNLINQLQKQKDELTLVYKTAITNGEKYFQIKNLYLNLRDVNQRLNDLMSIGL